MQLELQHHQPNIPGPEIYITLKISQARTMHICNIIYLFFIRIGRCVRVVRSYHFFLLNNTSSFFLSILWLLIIVRLVSFMFAFRFHSAIKKTKAFPASSRSLRTQFRISLGLQNDAKPKKKELNRERERKYLLFITKRQQKKNHSHQMP